MAVYLPPSMRKKHKQAGIVSKVVRLSKQVRLVKKRTDGELRVQDHAVAATTINGITTYASGALLYGDIAQGDGESDRNGEAIQPLKLTFRYRIIADPTAVSNTFRVIVVRTKVDAGAAPVLGAVLSQAAITNAFLSGYNDYNVKMKYNPKATGNIQILYDKIHEVELPLSGAGGVQQPTDRSRVHGKKSFDLSKTGLIKWSGTLGTAAQTLGGNIWLFVTNDNSTGTFQFTTQFFFSA